MVISIAKYSYLNSKIKAKIGKMLTIQDYKELLSKKTVNEVASYLKYNTSYSKILESIDENKVHRGELELILNKNQCRRALKLMRFVNGKEAKFMRYNLLRYEIEDIKMMLRALHIHHSLKDIEQFLFTHEKWHIDMNKLLASKTIEEFINNLKGTEYYNILNPLVESDYHVNMFTLEIALDMFYFRWVIRAKEKYLSGDDKKIVTKAVGEEIDLLNMLWIYRVKKYYNMDKELVYRYIIPGGYHISKDMYNKMVETETTEELLDLYKTTNYSHIFSTTNSIFIDSNYWSYVLSMHKNILKSKPYSIASIISYLHLKEVEIKFIITIIEGIRYGLPPDKIKNIITSLSNYT